MKYGINLLEAESSLDQMVTFKFLFGIMNEGVHNHVLNLLRKRTFGAEYYFESATKVLIRTIQDALKLQFDT